MRRWKKTGRWKRGAVILLAGLFLAAVAGGRLTGEKALIHRLCQQLAESAERKIFFDAVCAISPLIGSVLEEEPIPASASADIPVTVDEAAVWAEWEQLLLAEQTGSGMAETEPEPAGVSAVKEEEYFPEDMDEAAEAGMERDADLLAEIDRENEEMQEQARQQLLAQEQERARQEALEAAGQALPLPYSMEQLGDMDFLVTKLYNVNKTTVVDEELLNVPYMLEQDMSLEDPDSGGPKILIHHTHATEYFADSNEQDASTLIVGVGDYLEELLETRYGIEVLHDRTVYPYNEAYSQALKNVEQILEENPSIEVFIDLHRDAAGSKKYTVEIDGKEMANVMFFNGLSRNVNGPIEYLTNDNLKQNLAFSFQLKMAGDSMYPGLCKRNYLKSYRYNLHVLPRSVIIEVGDNNNSVQEAKNAMEPLARILNYVLNRK